MSTYEINAGTMHKVSKPLEELADELVDDNQDLG